MSKIMDSWFALRCLDNNINGSELYNYIELFTEKGYEETNFDFDVIISILRASLPIGLRLYKITNKPIGFISAKRNKDLTIDISYDNIPSFKNPLLVDSWIATGSTILAVKDYLGIDDVNLFGLVASKDALKKIKPKNYIIGYLMEGVNDKNYLIPPEPFKPRDGGDDLFNGRK